MEQVAVIQKKESIFKNLNFLLLFLGGVVSRLGSGIHSIGLVWYILEVKGSGLAIGTVLMLSSLPAVILGPFSGVLADRLDRKKVIVWMDIVRGLIAITMGLMILTGLMNFTYLVIGTIMLGLCGSLFNPAVSASIPNIVKDEHLTQANSLEHMSMNLTGMIGPILGGILIALWGVAGVFILNGISFLLSAFSEAFIQFPPQTNKSNDKVEFVKDLKEGASFIYQAKALFALLVTCLIGNFLISGSAVVALPLLFNQILQASSSEFGILQGTWGIGAAIGGFMLAMLPPFKKVFKVFVVSITTQTVFWILLGLVSLPFFINTLGLQAVKILVGVLLMATGVCNAAVNIPLMVAIQRQIPDEMRGRVFALLGTITQSMVPFSMGLTGLIANYVLPGYIIIVVGFGVILTIIDFVRKPITRTL